MNLPTPPSRQIEQEMAEILSSREFAASGDSLRKLIEEWLIRILKNFSIDAGTGNLLSILILTVTALALVLVLIFVILRISRLITSHSQTSGKARKIFGHLLSAEEALERAMKESQSGNYTAAVRWLFIEMLFTLDEQSYISINESKTNRQYVNELKKSRFPDLNKFQDLVFRFNNIRYGGKQAIHDDYMYWLDAAQSLSMDGLTPVGKGGDGHKKKQRK